MRCNFELSRNNVGIGQTMGLKLIDRYILKEIMVPAGIGTGVFIFVFMVSRLFRVTEMIVDQGIPPLYAIKLFLCLIPALLVFVVPMAFLLGVLLALARLSADNEIVVLKASGIGLYRMIPPVAVLSVLTFLCTAFFVFYAVPWGSKSFRETLLTLAGTKAKVDIQERVFNAPLGDIVIYVDSVSHGGKTLEGIMIYDERDPEANYTIIARNGRLAPDPGSQRVILHLSNGTIHTREVSGETYRTIAFQTYQFIISLREEIEKARGKGGMRILEKEMSIGDLREKIKRKKAAGENIRPQLVELHFKFAIPFAALIFGLVGIPLGVQRTQSGRSWGFILSLFVLLFYYILYCVGKDLASYGVVSPIMAAWAPNILFGALGVYLFRKTAKESPLQVILWGQKGLECLKAQWRKFARGI